ncbi:MAG: hypothetical protein AB1545_05345, partial [Thermodesulfobacteriota bacterium]
MVKNSQNVQYSIEFVPCCIQAPPKNTRSEPIKIIVHGLNDEETAKLLVSYFFNITTQTEGNFYDQDGNQKNEEMGKYH